MKDSPDTPLLVDPPQRELVRSAEPRSRLDNVPTPALVLDRERMDANIARMRSTLAPHNVALRPHLKTAKSVEVTRRLLQAPRSLATVSTLKEAETFAAAGLSDMIYAVGIAADKLDRVVALRRQGVDLALLLDSLDQAAGVAAKSRQSGESLPCWIEIDCDGHRGGLNCGDPAVIAIAGLLDRDGVPLRGVLTHSGESYNGSGRADEIVAAAEQERQAAVFAAEAIRAAGLPCPGVSVGSTPTALFGRNFAGVSEVRAGNFIFFDLVMADLGVCRPEDIAVSVLASVVGQRGDGRLIIDAGWSALSRDLGRSLRDGAPAYGVVCDLEGRVMPHLLVTSLNQEHGIVTRMVPGGSVPPLAIGSRVRVLPNHACATVGQHDRYHVVRTGSPQVEAMWPRFGGW